MASRLSEALSGYLTLRLRANRLQTLSEQAETIVIDAYDNIEPMYNALCHSVRALEELVEAMRVFSEIEQSISVVPDLIERCQAFAASACMWRDRVWKVLQACQIALPSVLLKGALP
jgi:midasin